MINTKNVRQKFLQILYETKNISNPEVRSKVMKNLLSLRDFIKEEYNYDRELPTLSHNFVSNILSDIDTLDLAIKEYILSVGYELPKDEEKDLKNIAKLSANFTNKYSYENTPVLKGRITNSRYIWHTNPNACQRCQDLDNTVYNKESDVPDKPHPNCKCSVEEIETKEDRCDCLDDLLEQLGKISYEAENLLKKINEAIEDFSNLANKIPDSLPKTMLENCIDALQQIFGTVLDFCRNYNDMKSADVKYADKYFHSKANCDGAKRGELGEEVAKAICDLREFFDLFKNVLIRGMTVKESLEDSKTDQEANRYGREQGRKHPNQDSRESVKIYRPNGLPEKY